VQKLQADPATKTIPIIVITGDPSIGQFMLTLGARACDATSLHLEVTRVLADRSHAASRRLLRQSMYHSPFISLGELIQ
jgi:hypothetical protein